MKIKSVRLNEFMQLTERAHDAATMALGADKNGVRFEELPYGIRVWKDDVPLTVFPWARVKQAFYELSPDAPATELRPLAKAK